jgi:hypothetical protein
MKGSREVGSEKVYERSKVYTIFHSSLDQLACGTLNPSLSAVPPPSAQWGGHWQKNSKLNQQLISTGSPGDGEMS